MPDSDSDYSEQAKIFSALSSELRLKLLRYATEGPVTAPDLAQRDEFEVTAETIVNNLNLLEGVGFLESRTVRGPGNRPRKEFSLKEGGFHLGLEAAPEGYRFIFE